MAESASRILEGVFAISKPPSLSSAQVLRELQSTFTSSKTFAPLLQDTLSKQEASGHVSKRRRRANDAPFKMGHGGTLDPLATGILIVGIGRGTKHLQNFLGCTKTYETVVLFGKSTDTYDIAGKVVGEAEYKHITKEMVESKLDRFRGKIRQVPPVYSALKINGMKAYEYARSGKELPRELESREMQVDECTLLEWFNGGEHDFRWPAEEAPEEEKRAVAKLMGTATPLNEVINEQTFETEGEEKQPATVVAESFLVQEHASTNTEAAQISEQVSSPTASTISSRQHKRISPSEKAALHTHDHTLNLSPLAAISPAARIRLTVSSGFYVRSFAHDLGQACSSAGTMASLLRSRQGIYTVTAPPESQSLVSALTYDDLKAGEDAWGPKITAQLEQWIEENPAKDQGHVDGRNPDVKRQIQEERDERPKQRFRGEWTADTKQDRRKQQGGKWKGKWNEGGNRGKMHERVNSEHQPEKRRRERNSSSPE